MVTGQWSGYNIGLTQRWASLPKIGNRYRYLPQAELPQSTIANPQLFCKSSNRYPQLRSTDTYTFQVLSISALKQWRLIEFPDGGGGTKVERRHHPPGGRQLRALKQIGGALALVKGAPTPASGAPLPAKVAPTLAGGRYYLSYPRSTQRRNYVVTT